MCPSAKPGPAPGPARPQAQARPTFRPDPARPNARLQEKVKKSKKYPGIRHFKIQLIPRLYTTIPPKNQYNFVRFSHNNRLNMEQKADECEVAIENLPHASRAVRIVPVM